jgi:hypothetical protein
VHKCTCTHTVKLAARALTRLPCLPPSPPARPVAAAERVRGERREGVRGLGFRSPPSRKRPRRRAGSRAGAAGAGRRGPARPRGGKRPRPTAAAGVMAPCSSWSEGGETAGRLSAFEPARNKRKRCRWTMVLSRLYNVHEHYAWQECVLRLSSRYCAAYPAMRGRSSGHRRFRRCPCPIT